MKSFMPPTSRSASLHVIRREQQLGVCDLAIEYRTAKQPSSAQTLPPIRNRTSATRDPGAVALLASAQLPKPAAGPANP